MDKPPHAIAATIPRHPSVRVLADSTSLQWSGIYVRRHRYPCVVDRFLVPATPEPHIACILAGSAAFRERDEGGEWITRTIRRGDVFVTRSKVPYEICWRSPRGEEIDVLSLHLDVALFLSAIEASFPDRGLALEVSDFFGRDEALAHLCFACAEMLEQGVRGESRRVTSLVQLITASLVEKYADAASAPPEYRGGLPIGQLRKVQDYIAAHLAEPLTLETLARLVELSPFHFARVFKQTTGVSPRQFVTRERITRAQLLIRETSRSLIEIALEVGYVSPSHFAQVFRRIAGVTPTRFRNGL